MCGKYVCLLFGCCKLNKYSETNTCSTLVFKNGIRGGTESFWLKTRPSALGMSDPGVDPLEILEVPEFISFLKFFEGD